MLINLKLKNLLFACLMMVLSAWAYSQDAPLLSEPGNNTNCKLPTLSFVWLSTNGAINYTFNISETANFATLVDSKTQTEVSCTSTKLNYNKTYYWKVSANYVQGGNTINVWSQVNSFSTKNLPIQISPINGATCQLINLDLKWAEPIAGDTFQLQIDTDMDFINPIHDEILYTNIKNITLPNYDRVYYWRVKSFRQLSCPNDWTPIYSFKTTRIAPTPLNPPSNSTAMSLNPSFNWSNIPAGLAYEIQISTNATFTSVVTDEISDTPNFSAIESLNYNTKYFWRIKVKYPDCYSDWSSVFNFTTMYATTKLVSPAENLECVSLTPKLIWRKVLGTTNYKIQLNTINDFKYPAVELNNVTDTSVIVTLNKGLTKYYWRVIAEDKNNKGEYSLVNVFQTTYKYPESVYPLDLAGAVKRAITFKWDKSGERLKYSLQVSKKSDFSTFVVNDSNINTNEYTTFLNDFYTVYYWRVKVADTLCSSDWSNFWSFTTELSQPTLSTPLNKSTKQQLYLTCTWILVKGATAYHYQCSTDSTFGTLFYGSYSASIPLGLEQLEPNKKYWWRVRSADKNGTSEWSAVYSFTTGPQGPEIATLISPSKGTIKTALSQELKWNAALRATKYRLQVSEDENFGTFIKDTQNVITTNLKISGLKNFTTYYWRVFSINDSGTAKSSQIWNFRTIAIAPTDVPILKTPEDATKDMDISVNFVWYQVARATEYEIQIAKDNTFTNPISRVLGNNTTRRDDLEFEKTYYWRVKGINEAGETSWSKVWTFTTKKFVSVNDEYFVDKLDIFPNPVVETSIIKLNLINTENTQIQILDIKGNIIQNIHNGNLNSGLNQFRINTNNLISGTYFIKVQLGENITYRKIVINK